MSHPEPQVSSQDDTVERDVMEFNAIIVGGGPAGLACAIRLKQLKPDWEIVLLEKGAAIGDHILAGAVIEPEALGTLLGAEWHKDMPASFTEVTEDNVLYLSKDGMIDSPIIPPQMFNHGNYIISLQQMAAWLGGKAEELGINVFAGQPARSALIEDGRVVGVRLQDVGIAKDGTKKADYTPGMDLKAPVTVFAEGARGSITKQLVKQFGLDANSDPQTYGIGYKELWEVPEGQCRPGLVQHTIGFPVDAQTYGGGFCYHMKGNRVSIGYVVGLDYEDPNLPPFEVFRQFKSHPEFAKVLTGGKVLSGGARAIAKGGWQSVPKTDMPGAIIIGCASGLLNMPKIKGIHQALKSGMLAAEHMAEGEVAKAEGYDAKLRASPIMTELKRVRNIAPGFKKGLWFALANAGLETATFGFTPYTLKNVADAGRMKRVGQWVPKEPLWGAGPPKFGPKNRQELAYFAGTHHEEDQPSHLLVADTDICVTRCVEEYNNPCTRFCPVAVYEIVPDDKHASGKRLQINASNCIHCKTCDIKDPYEIITWVTPEGGGGPQYQGT